MYSENSFIQLLESGNLKTQLSEKKTQQMKSILKQYKDSKKFDSQPVKRKLLTVKTLELHNKIIEEKGTDFINLSYASDEEPIGRGISRDHSKKQKRYFKESHARYTELKDCSKSIESCSDSHKSHVVSTTTTEAETPSKTLSSLLLRRKMVIKENQKKDILKQHPLEGSNVSTISLYNSPNKDNDTENKFEKEEEPNIDNALNYEEDRNISNKVISDKESNFAYDDNVRQVTCINEEIHDIAEKQIEDCFEIVKKREYHY